MKNKPFNKPRFGKNRIYTRRGDSGKTSLVGGQRVWKDSLRIDCCGAVDELNSFIGMACVSAIDLSAQEPRFGELASILRRLQHELFILGWVLSTETGDVSPEQACITGDEIEQLEREIDSVNENLPALRAFVLPGGSQLSSELHACRTICRRAERETVALSKQENVPPEVVRYLNRLGDAFFVWSRWVNHLLDIPEVLWDPNSTVPDQ